MSVRRVASFDEAAAPPITLPVGWSALNHPVHPPAVAREAMALEPDNADEQLVGARAEATEEHVQTVLSPGAAPETSVGGSPPAAPLDRPANQLVLPMGGPDHKPGANNCWPSTGAASLDWEPVEADKDNWRPDARALTLAGVITFTWWPTRPSEMVVPNTPNPVDGGNINNDPRSPNYFRAVIKDMADYDTSGGGAGPNWHSTEATLAHEHAHWIEDYVGDAVMGAKGGNWVTVNTSIDALREPKAKSPTATEAKAALKPRVSKEVSKWRKDTNARWDDLIKTTDHPGAGGRGYAAGARELAGLIAKVNAYARAKGWT